MGLAGGMRRAHARAFSGSPFPLNVVSVPISVSSGGGSFTEPAAIFSGTANLPTSLFTGIALISDITLANLVNSTKVVAQGAAGGGTPRASCAREAASAARGRSAARPS